MTTKLNDEKWYKEPTHISLDRLGLLTIVGGLELVLKHPNLPENSRRLTVQVGKALASMLIDDGIILPDEMLEAWEKAFKIKCELRPDEDLNVVYLDNYGQPWK